MPFNRCASCGKEYEKAFGDSPTTFLCPECEKQRASEVQDPFVSQTLPGQSQTGNTNSPVTLFLISINVLVYLIMVLRGVSWISPTPQQAIAFGADFGPLTLSGQWWRLFTSMFVHFGIIHIALNMWCLWNLGQAAEVFMGRVSYLLAYFISGLLGSIASVFFNPYAAGAGASGAIFGLAGTLVVFIKLKKTPQHIQPTNNALGSLGTFILFNIIFGATRSGISNSAHIGGLVMGGVVGLLLPTAIASESARRFRLGVTVVLSTAILLTAFLFTKRINADVIELSSIEHLLSAGKGEEAFARTQQLVAHHPENAGAQSLLGTMYLHRGQSSEAIIALKKAYDEAPQNPAYQIQLGSAYLATGQFNQAAEFFQKLLADNRRNSRAAVGLGNAYVGLGQYDKAIPQFQAAANLSPESTVALHALGQAQIRTKQYADARDTFQRILRKTPNDTAAKNGLALASQSLNN